LWWNINVSEVHDASILRVKKEGATWTSETLWYRTSTLHGIYRPEELDLTRQSFGNENIWTVFALFASLTTFELVRKFRDTV
jgi:hypothetical protein